MKTINIFHFDDNSRSRINVHTYITGLNIDYEEQKLPLSMNLKEFDNTDSLIQELHNNHIPDILILDMYHGTQNVGETVLNTIKELRLAIPTILYTIGNIEDHFIDYKETYKRYSFIYGEKIDKGTNGDDLKQRIKLIIESDSLTEPIFTIDEDDIFLTVEINSIGKDNLNQILLDIKKGFDSNSLFNIERMPYGLSGAYVFRLKYNEEIHVLKISKDKEALKKEHVNSKKIYKKFPAIFRIYIDSEGFETSKYYAILLENVHNANTLYDWLYDIRNQNDIEEYFKKLYSDETGLALFYRDRNNIYTKEKNKFTQIFENFKYSLAAKAIEELKPLIDKFSDKFNESNIKNLVLNGIYENIDKNKLIGDKYLKYKIICHADFHSNNIMVQGKNPKIIDTGGIRYHYWCMDICRLIVNLFIFGFNRGSIQYFDISEIPNDLNIAKKIITLEELPVDGSNDGYIHAINWLVKNVESIYEPYYSTWEFQLGLCKEFLQMANRTNSVPPNKRTVALLASYESMLMANKNVLDLIVR